CPYHQRQPDPAKVRTKELVGELLPLYQRPLPHLSFGPSGAADVRTARLNARSAPHMRWWIAAAAVGLAGTVFGATPVGAQGGADHWRLIRTPNPRGGPDAVSIMQAADPSRSDLGLAGLMLRCSQGSFDVLIVVLEPFPPRAHPKVKLTIGKTTSDFDAMVLPSGAALALPAAATKMFQGSGQVGAEVAVEVVADAVTLRGAISLAGLESALALLRSNCPVS